MSMIADGCTVLGDVENSILSQGVYVGENAKIKDSVILGNVLVEDGSLINKCVVNSRSQIKAGSIIGNGKDIILYSGDGMIE
jgi:glucose-1-phosphate adenylyltransferase